MFGLGGTLQHREEMAAPLPLHLRRLSLDPTQTSVDQLDVAHRGDVVLTDQVGLQLTDTAVGLAVDAVKVTHHGIDRDACGAMTFVEVIGHQQAFGGPWRGNPLNRSDLRDAARHIAGALLVKRADELFPVIALQAENTAQESSTPVAPAAGAAEASQSNASIWMASGRV